MKIESYIKDCLTSIQYGTHQRFFIDYWNKNVIHQYFNKGERRRQLEGEILEYNYVHDFLPEIVTKVFEISNGVHK